MLIPTELNTLDEFIEAGPYVGYCYAYPHKTAYREFDSPIPLQEAWKDESREAMFLYLHVPFCEMRCGFCNLFTFSQPNSDVPSQYLQTVQRQARIIRRQIGPVRFGQMAIGGGTPTFLSTPELEFLFDTVGTELGIDVNQLPVSIESSPATIDREKLRLLRDRGVERLSMGVQSFEQQDLKQIGRPQKQAQLFSAIELAKETGFPKLNLDLIYGGENQNMQSWIRSVETCLEFLPDEIFLYPLYVRPLTGLDRRPLTGLDRRPNSKVDQRIEMYRAARVRLLEHGYRQRSMRMFERPHSSSLDSLNSRPTGYRCQEDGMLGLGVGARSYTRNLHYSSRFAVKQKSVGQIIDRYIKSTDRELSGIDYGIRLDRSEQQTRYLIISILLVEGFELDAFKAVFNVEALDAFPQLQELLDRELTILESGRLTLTDRGLELSDTIGPWLYSQSVRNRMDQFQWSEA